MNHKLRFAIVSMVGLAACKGSEGGLGPAGPSGPSGPSGIMNPASVSAIVPDSAFLGRTVDVEVSGFNTTWSASTTADFGTGVTVMKTNAASATALVVTISVDPTAALGPRDVKINDGANQETFKGAFTIESPMKLTTQGTQAQGTIILVSGLTSDLTTLFDATSVGGNPLFGIPPSFPNFNFTPVPGAIISVTNVTPLTFDAQVAYDVMATPGPLTLNAKSGPPDSTTTDFTVPNALNMQQRMATPLTSNTTTSITVDKAFASSLHSFAPGGDVHIVDVATRTKSSTASPIFNILPSSGKFQDSISGFATDFTFVTLTADNFYVISLDAAGGLLPYTIRASATAAGSSAMETATAHGTPATAQHIASLPFVLLHGSLHSAAEQDWYSYTATSQDVGKSFHVQTVAPDAQTDTVVDVLDSMSTTLGGPSSDLGTTEDFTSSPITAAGVYYIKVYASVGFSVRHTEYTAIVRLQ
jgi:hypothetical protein